MTRDAILILFICDIRLFSEKTMRINNNLHQFDDDDFFNDGPCPSCRLAINKETGRLKWAIFHVVCLFVRILGETFCILIFAKWVNLSQNAGGARVETKHGDSTLS